MASRPYRNGFRGTATVHQRSLYYFWPGLPHLWLQGNLTGLAVALAFSSVGNVLLILTFAWPFEPFSWIVWLGWPSFIFGWVVGVRRQLSHPVSSLASSPADSALSDQLLLEAQRAYLGRQWSEASRIVDELLKENPNDLESRLLHVAVQRRAGRLEHARSELSIVASFDERGAWQHEIDVERRLLTEIEAADSAETSEDDRIESEPTGSASPASEHAEENEAPDQNASYDSTYSTPGTAHREPSPTDSSETHYPADPLADDQRATGGLSNLDPPTNNSPSISADGEPRHSSRPAA